MCVFKTLKQEPVTLKLPWRTQEVQDARAIEYLQRKVVNRKWNQPRRKKFVAVNKDDKEVEDLKTALTSAMEIESLKFAKLVSCAVLWITDKELDGSQERL